MSNTALRCGGGGVLTCSLLDANSGTLQIGGLGVDGSVIEGVRGQAIKAVLTFQASDGDLLRPTVRGWCGRGERGRRLKASTQTE